MTKPWPPPFKGKTPERHMPTTAPCKDCGSLYEVQRKRCVYCRIVRSSTVTMVGAAITAALAFLAAIVLLWVMFA